MASQPIPAMTSYQQVQSPVVVIGPQFLAPYPVDLKVATKLLSLGECNLGVTDANGALIFKVKSKLLSIRDRRYLLDAADVFLAANTREDVPDFKVKGSWFERSCTIYLGQSNTIIAQMHRKHTLSTIVFDADNFGVTVYPNIDYAFIVSLVVILDEINEDRRGDD
ncbi:hypothetical protein JCGZ_00387 [Jatropha curcas]|uniref:Protein LURP-one-related 15 n=1 Tax=Jatropha curcas TaxID=180498 RepID=A0A067JS31_JATCU|nr:hypothetical protein JCGZ_00387 [Jatropha curcas]